MASEKKHYPQQFNDNYTADDIEDVKAIIDWMNQDATRDGKSVAKMIGISDAYVSTLVNGKHQVAARKHIDLILAVMDFKITRLKQGDFVKTSVSTIVNHTCDFTRRNGGFGVISGAPGVGKTRCLMEYQKKHPNSVLIYGDEFSNAGVITNMLLDALGIKINGKYTPKQKMALIVNTLLDSGRLVILDETDKCQKGSMAPLRQIVDKANCGVVLAGNTDLKHQIKIGNDRYDLIESRTRVWPKVIRHISRDDVANLLKTFISPNTLASGEDFSAFAKYCGEVCQGDARKLLDTLARQIRFFDEGMRKQNEKTYRGVNRELVKRIATDFMGIDNPPPIPRRETAV